MEAEEAIAAISTHVTARAAADVAPGHLAADVIFRSIGMEGDFGAVEHHQQLGLLRVQPGEETVERDEPCLQGEDAIKPRSQDGLASLIWTVAVSLESAIVLPDQVADAALGFVVLVGEGVKLVNKALRVNPACVR